MSITSEITRLQTSKADIKTQVNVDKEWINENTDFITSEKLDEYDSKISDMQDAYKQYIPIYTKMIAKGDTIQNGTPTPDAPVEVENVTGLQVVRVCGKNLINYEDFTGTITNYYFKGLPSTNFSLEAGKTYTLSFDIVSSVTPFAISVGAGTTGYAVDIKQNSNYQNGRNSITFTPTQSQLANGNILFFRAPRYGTSQSSVTFTISNVQLEESSSATTYEKYQSKDYEINLGKNLFNINDRSSVSDDVTINNEGWITITYDNTSGSSTKVFNCKMNPSTLLKSDTTYRMFLEIANIEGTGRLTINEGNSNSSQFQSGAVYSFTDFSNNNIYYKDLITWSSIDNRSVFFNQYMFFNAGQSGSITYRVSLIADTTLTTNNFTYSPYFTPIELNKIGNYQDFIKKGTGKNLINVSNGSVTTNGVTGSWNNNFVQLSGTNTKTDANWILLGTANFDFPDFKIGETYTISALGKSNKTYVQINYNVGDTTTQKALVTMSGESKSFIVPEDFGRINFMFIGIVRTTGAINENWYLQLEKDSATSYEPYGYGDKWYIEKNVGKVVLNGSEDWQKRHTGTENWYYSILLDNTPIQGLGFCSHYESATISNSNTLQGFMCVHDEKVLRIRYGTEDSVTNYKTWLSSNNVTLYYVLANPTYTLIENEELLNQLEAVQLQTGENNVLVSGDLPMILDLSKYIQIAENHL